MNGSRGSVSVEFAALMPLLAIAMLLVAQVGVLVSEQVAVQHGAREGARAAAVGRGNDEARETALEAGNLDPACTETSITPASREVGTPVTFSITYTPVILPIIARFVPGDIELKADVTMRSEDAT